MKINFALASRSLIALLFVVAGIRKIMDFAGTTGFIESLGVPLPMLVTILVIIIEVPVALAFAYGYKVRETGYVLIGFTVLATLLVHKDVFGRDMIMALKNLSLIGGLMAAIACTCTNCTVHGKKG
jgi:putative oxidoreductase